VTLTPFVAVTNESTVLNQADYASLIQALQMQVHTDFRPIWNTAAHLFPGTPTTTEWQLVILDTADQAGALGYHETTPAGYPLGKVFAKTTLDDGGSVSVTASHELLEMLADPYIDTAVQVAQDTFYSLEVCDPCEADAYSYTLNGVAVSDFVTPTWFSGGSAPYDHGHAITRPHELLSGGYIGRWTPSTGWTQRVQDATAPKSPRLQRRAQKHGQPGELKRVKH